MFHVQASAQHVWAEHLHAQVSTFGYFEQRLDTSEVWPNSVLTSHYTTYNNFISRPWTQLALPVIQIPGSAYHKDSPAMYANHQRLGQPDTSIDTSAARSELFGWDNDYAGEVDVRIQHGDQVGDRATSPMRPIPPKAPRTRKAVHGWDTHKSEIIECYMAKDWPLEDVREHMKARHGFDAT